MAAWGIHLGKVPHSNALAITSKQSQQRCETGFGLQVRNLCERSTMARRLVLQGVLILWLVEAARTGGNVPQNGGRVGSFLIPSKGVGQTLGQQNGYAGYPMKGMGYEAVAGMNKGVGMDGYGLKAGPSIGQQLKGYATQAAAYGRQGTKGYGVKAGLANPQKMKGNGAEAALQNGFGTKGNGYGVMSGPTTGQQIKGNEAPAGRYVGQATKGNGISAYDDAYSNSYQEYSMVVLIYIRRQMFLRI
ncbi:hypothetical protein AMECASPLE_015000 [Ameca splendens]|uniref:Uncharacterized protein n=1 Tax=Ameca splendens TaxID=208324 RepID=A0ABV0YCU0_9TELE